MTSFQSMSPCFGFVSFTHILKEQIYSQAKRTSDKDILRMVKKLLVD